MLHVQKTFLTRKPLQIPVVRELNNTWAKSLGVVLELVSWETHAFPGIGSDPQEVINEEIGDDYDIFVGLLSTRFGSQTPRAGSGTAEEFERAYRRFQENPKQLRVMFYFKDPEIKASELDLAQYALVRGFQSKLGDKGALYWTFTTTDELTAYLRIHLGRQLQAWAVGVWGMADAETVPVEEGQTESDSVPVVTQADESDLGYLDLIESGSENIQNSTETLTHMLEALNDLTAKIEVNTPKFSEAAESQDIGRMKHITNYIAEILEQFAERMDTELPIFSRTYSAGMDAISRAASLWQTDFKSEDKSPIGVTHTNVQQLVSAIGPARENIAVMEEVVSTLPRLTATFNKAKQHTKSALNNFNRELSAALDLTIEREKELRRIMEG